MGVFLSAVFYNHPETEGFIVKDYSLALVDEWL